MSRDNLVSKPLLLLPIECLFEYNYVDIINDGNVPKITDIKKLHTYSGILKVSCC